MLQSQDYHQFVDTRTFFGIPNAMDVLSNVIFLIAGLLGIVEVMKRHSELLTKHSWLWFFISIMLIAPGSAFYHWNPTDETLVWDRLPMSMGFMALYIVLWSEHITIKSQKFLYPALILGILSVVTWVMTADLRFYFWVQFSSFVTIPLILILFPSIYTKKIYYLVALGMYGVAKWAEMNDEMIFEYTNHVMSGHTLKHLLAGLGLLALWYMVRNRKVYDARFDRRAVD